MFPASLSGKGPTISIAMISIGRLAIIVPSGALGRFPGCTAHTSCTRHSNNLVKCFFLSKMATPSCKAARISGRHFSGTTSCNHCWPLFGSKNVLYKSPSIACNWTQSCNSQQSFALLDVGREGCVLYSLDNKIIVMPGSSDCTFWRSLDE